MSLTGAERFFYGIMYNEEIRGRCLKIAALPERERGAAIRELGYSFSPGELDSVVCREFYRIPDKILKLLGPGDMRDIVMSMWGNYM
ncbi:hypothetical protein [Cloacibacillus sp.]